MSNTRLISYKCPVCGGIVRFAEGSREGVCQSCGNQVAKERTVTLNFASNSNSKKIDSQYIFKEDQFRVGLADSLLSVDKSAIEYKKVEFQSTEIKNLSPQKLTELEGLIKKLHYGYDDIFDDKIVETARQIAKIDSNNIYACFLLGFFTTHRWLNFLTRQDALDIYSFILPYINRAYTLSEYKDLTPDKTKILFDYISATKMSDDKKAKCYDLILTKYYITNESGRFETVLPVLSAIEKLNINKEVKYNLFVEAIYQLFQTSDVKEFATAMCFFVETTPHDCKKYILRLISSEVVNNFSIVGLRDIVNYIDSLPSLSNTDKADIVYNLLRFGINNTYVENNQSTSLLFMTIHDAKVSEKDKMTLYNKAIDWTKNNSRGATLAAAYIVNSDFPDVVKKNFVEKMNSCYLDEIKSAVYNIDNGNYPMRQEVIYTLFSKISTIDKFSSVADMFQFINSLSLDSKIRNKIYLMLLANKVKKDVTSLFGYLSLYQFIDDDAIRFSKICELLVINKKELFLQLKQFELLYESGEINDDEFLLVLDVMRKTIAFSVAEGKIPQAIEELKSMQKDKGLFGYSDKVILGNEKYIKWLSKSRLKNSGDASKDLTLLKIIEKNEVTKDNIVFSNTIKNERKLMTLYCGIAGVFALVDLIFISVLFTQAKFEWYFNVSQALRIILDIIWVALHAVFLLVFLLKVGKMTTSRYFTMQVVSTAVISILMMAMIPVFAVSYSNTVQDSYHTPIQISSAADLKKIENMPYCSFELVDDIRLTSEDVCYKTKGYNCCVSEFHGYLNGNGYSIGVVDENDNFIHRGLYRFSKTENEYLVDGRIDNLRIYGWSASDEGTNRIVCTKLFNNDEERCSFEWVDDYNPEVGGLTRSIAIKENIEINRWGKYPTNINFTYRDDGIRLFIGGEPKEWDYNSMVYYYIENHNDIVIDENGYSKYNYWTYSYFNSKTDFEIKYVRQGEWFWHATNDAVCFD